MSTTTKFYTRAEIIRKVQLDLDLEDEEFVQSDEMIGYVNEAVEETEKIVHDLHEDYFLRKSDPIAVVSGEDEIDLPSDIFANKIRKLVYVSGGRAYVVERIKNWHKFEEYTDSRLSSPGETDEWKYFITNAAPGERKILLSPPPAESGNLLTAWYLRRANRLEEDDDVLDIPEAYNFVVQYVKVRCTHKEKLPADKEEAILLAMRGALEATLTGMVPDDENELEMDLSIYEEMN